MEKPIVFISHIAEEREIAHSLKTLVERAFIGMMDVFVSSDPSSIHLGQKWLDKISHALHHCAIGIVIASPVSIRRSWVNFEAGAGWIRDIPVIPLCHSGMTPDKLPPPLNAFQAATATDHNQLRMITPVLAKALGAAVPNVDFTAFILCVIDYENTTAKHIAISEPKLLPELSGLTDYEVTTLVHAAEHGESPNVRVSSALVRESVKRIGYRAIDANLAMKMLERKGLLELRVEHGYNDYELASVVVTDDGWLWLHANRPAIEQVPFQVKDEKSDGKFGDLDNEVPF